jgi:hypothetical protein
MALTAVRVPRTGLRPILLLYLPAASAIPSCVCQRGRYAQGFNHARQRVGVQSYECVWVFSSRAGNRVALEMPILGWLRVLPTVRNLVVQF